MSLNVALDARYIHMGFLAFDQGFGNIAMAAGTIIIGNRIPVSYLFGRMGGMTAFAVGQNHCFGVGLMTAEAFRRFSVRGMTFETIQFGMQTGAFQHRFSRFGMTGNTGRFDL